MELPQLEINTIITPAETEKVFDKGWLTQLTVVSDDPNATSVYAIIRPARTLEDGSTDILVKENTETVVRISDLFGVIAGNNPKVKPETVQKLAIAMGAVLDALNNYNKDINE
jgi:hypothetical protein